MNGDSMNKAEYNKSFEYPIIFHDEEYDSTLTWCPNCGCNAYIVTFQGKLGKCYRCKCGLRGRFGDGLPEPEKEQPSILEY